MQSRAKELGRVGAGIRSLSWRTAQCGAKTNTTIVTNTSIARTSS
jgi:hypothetical protein